MKKVFIYFLLLFSIVFTANAQKDSTKPKKTVSEFDMKNYKSDPNDRLIFEINYTTWMGISEVIKPDWKCIGFGFYTLFDKPIANSNFSFGYGLGFYGHNYSSNAKFVYQFDSLSKQTLTFIDTKKDSYKSNRYNERSIELPLEIRFRTKTKTTFKMMLGARIGYVASNFFKIDDANGKIRMYDIKNINRLRYGINFRIGVEQLCLTASYYLSEVFTERGPKGIHPFSVGIAIIPY